MSGYRKKKEHHQGRDTKPQERQQPLPEEQEPVAPAEKPEPEEAPEAAEPGFEQEPEPDQAVADIWHAMNGGGSAYEQSLRSMQAEPENSPSLGSGEIVSEPESQDWEMGGPEQDIINRWDYTEEPSFLEGDAPVNTDPVDVPVDEPPANDPFAGPIGESPVFQAAFNAAMEDQEPERGDLYEPEPWGPEEEIEPAQVEGNFGGEPMMPTAEEPGAIQEEWQGYSDEPGFENWGAEEVPATDPFAEPAAEAPEADGEMGEDMLPGEVNWFDMVPNRQPRADDFAQPQPAAPVETVEPGASDEEFEQYQASSDEDDAYEGEEEEDDEPESEEAVAFKQKLAATKRSRKTAPMKQNKKHRRRNPEADRKKNNLIKTVIAVLFCVVVVISQFDRVKTANALIGITTLPSPQPSETQPLPAEPPNQTPTSDVGKEIADFRYIDVAKLNKMTAAELAAWFEKEFRTGGVWNEDAYAEFQSWYNKKAELDSEFDKAYRDALGTAMPAEEPKVEPPSTQETKPSEQPAPTPTPNPTPTPAPTPTPTPAPTPTPTPAPTPSSKYKHIDAAYLDGATAAEVANWVYETFPTTAGGWETDKYNEYKSWIAEKRAKDATFAGKVDSYLNIMGWTDKGT